MAIPSRQIGWGTEDNLLWQISKQLERLTCVTAGGCGSITTTTTTSTVAPTTTTTTTLPVYQVFTALLTQSGGAGGDDQNNGAVLKGRTYQIIDNDNGDFSNVGAPDNNNGTYFIATATATPNSYGGAALAFNTGAPVANVLENTIGNIWFTYTNIGNYEIESNALFTDNKTILLSAYFTGTNSDVTYNTIFNQVDSSTIGIGIADGNGYLNGSPIEIRVYN